jgi:hypothetical protein
MLSQAYTLGVGARDSQAPKTDRNQHSGGPMPARRKGISLAGGLLAMLPILLWDSAALAQSPPPWHPPARDDAYRPPPSPPPWDPPLEDEAYRPPPRPVPGQNYYPPGAEPKHLPGTPYVEPGYNGPDRTYSQNEIVDAGHHFFGAITQGLARVIEHAFERQGRPNGYILGQDAGGAFIAGVRYGEGVLYTKDAGAHRVYWQGPSIGYDAGADGSKVMVLVYNLRDPTDIYRRFGGVDGSAYVVGGVGLTFQKNGDIITAPIRTGIGLRLGANVGYLKYTRLPTWFPF